MFLINNPNRNYKQYTYPRRGGGYTAPQIVLHTYEAPYTRSLTAAATWLTTRSTPGSYHALAGARSTKDVLQLASWSYETWHSVPSNNWSIGISAVTYASAWDKIPAQARENLVKSMAYAAANAAKWLERYHGRTVQPRLLTRAQAMRKESGFVYHATMDPGRRSDPGKNFPWAMFITEFKRLMRGGSATTAPSTDWLDMVSKKELEDIIDARVGRAVWGYKNTKLENRDAYSILRRVADRSEKTNHAVGRVEGIHLPALLESAGVEVDAAAVAEAILNDLDIEGAVERAIEALPERDTAEVAQRVREDIATRLTGDINDSEEG